VTDNRPSAITSEPRRLSVVVPTLNAGPRFEEVLEALASQDVEGGFQLVVIDSGSTDGTREAAEAAGARVEVIDRSEFNHGGTRNRGIGLADGEVCALLTQDAVPIGRDYLANLTRPFERENVDGTYARQYPRPDCDPILKERLRQWSASRDEPVLQVLSPGDPEASRQLFARLPPIERYLSCAFDNVASAVRRSSWERIPFPEASFGEDVAWARSVLLAGGSVAYEPTASVEHSHRIDLVREFKRLYCDHRNLVDLFELRNVPSWRAVRSGWRGQIEVYRKLLEDQPLGRLERLRWRLYSIPYAFLEGAAQFLGARSHWKTEESRFWRWFDRRVRQGV
jgi:rhamnosyltransferase